MFFSGNTTKAVLTKCSFGIVFRTKQTLTEGLTGDRKILNQISRLLQRLGFFIKKENPSQFLEDWASFKMY